VGIDAGKMRALHTLMRMSMSSTTELRGPMTEADNYCEDDDEVTNHSEHNNTLLVLVLENS